MARDIFVAPIARATNDDSALGGGHALNRLNKRLNSIGVMTIVGNDCAAPIVKDIKAPGGGLGVVDEGGQARFDGFPAEPQGPGSSDRSHGIFDLKADGAVTCQGDGT